MVLVEICAKNDKFWWLNPIFEKLGVTYDFGWWLVGKPMSDIIFALIELFFAIYYGCRVMRRNVYISDVFAGGRPLCTQILPGQGRPHNHSRHRKTRDTGLSVSKNRILQRSLVLTQYWRVPDRRTDGFAVAHTTLAKLAFASAVKTNVKEATVWMIGFKFQKQQNQQTTTCFDWRKIELHASRRKVTNYHNNICDRFGIKESSESHELPATDLHATSNINN